MTALTATERTARSRARQRAERDRLVTALHRIALSARSLDAARKLATMALLLEPARSGPQEAAGGAAASGHTARAPQDVTTP